MIAASFLLTAAGLAALGLANPQHYAWLFGRPPSRPRRRALLIAGPLLLAHGLAAAMYGWDPATGAVAWFGLLTLAAALLLGARTFLR